MTQEQWREVVTATSTIAGVAFPAGAAAAPIAGALVNAVMQDLQTDGELTPDQSQAFVDELLAFADTDAAKTDDELAAEEPPAPADTAPGGGSA